MSSDHGSRLRALHAEMLVDARAFRGSDPTNNTIARRLEYFSEKLDALLQASASAPPDEPRWVQAARKLVKGTRLIKTGDGAHLLEMALADYNKASALSPDPSALQEAATPPDHQENTWTNHSNGMKTTSSLPASTGVPSAATRRLKTPEAAPRDAATNGDAHPANERGSLKSETEAASPPAAPRETEGHEPGCPAIADDESDDTTLDNAGMCVCSRQERHDVVHRILHEFQGTKCRSDGGWCDARDHVDAILAALRAPAEGKQ